METSTLPSLKQAALGDLQHELATTRRVLERLPDEHLAWKPHEKSWSLGQLALHITNLLRWQAGIVEHEGFDLAAAPLPLSAGPASRDELLRRFDRNAAALQGLLDALDDAGLAQPWTLRRGEQVLLTQPRVAALRGFGISHLIHHRGQLTVYLRLLDVPVPPVYGPTADEGGP